MRAILPLLIASCAFAQTFTVQTSGTKASLRGVWAVNDQIVWASGAHGTYLRTTDGGMHWTAAVVPGAEGLDFRDVQGVDANTAYLLSIGKGETSRVIRRWTAARTGRSRSKTPTPRGSLTRWR